MHEIWGRKILRNILFAANFLVENVICWRLGWSVPLMALEFWLRPQYHFPFFSTWIFVTEPQKCFRTGFFSKKKVSHSPSVYISLYFYFLPLFALLPDKLGFAPRREVLQQFRDIRQTLATPWQEMCFTIAMVGFVILQFFILRTFPSISLG